MTLSPTIADEFYNEGVTLSMLKDNAWTLVGGKEIDPKDM